MSAPLPYSLPDSAATSGLGVLEEEGVQEGVYEEEEGVRIRLWPAGQDTSRDSLSRDSLSREGLSRDGLSSDGLSSDCLSRQPHQGQTQ